MAQSSSSSGNKLKARNKDEHPSTDPFEETAMLERSSVKTQLVDLNGDTEELDIPYFADNMGALIVDDSENDVVLDSDDEEIKRNKVLTIMNGLFCDGPKKTMGDKSGFLMRRGSTVAVSKSVEANCLAKSSLTDIGSRESSEEALDFVDHYLSLVDVNLPQKVEIGKRKKLTSPPALSSKGSRNLARGANLRTKAWDSQIFDWDDNQPELILGWKSQKVRSVSRPQLASNPKFQEERKIGEKCKDKELGKQFVGEPLRQQAETNSSECDVPDMDVGYDTQIAAEAIESLLYAPPPCDDANTGQGEKNMLENTSKCATVKNAALGCSFLGSGSHRSEVTARFYKRTKRSGNKLSRNKSASIQNDCKNKVELDLSVEVRKKVRRGKPLTDKCTRDVNSKSWTSETSSKVTQKEKKTSMTTEDTNCDYGRKRRSGLDTDKLLGERKKCSTLGFDSSLEATNCEANSKKLTSPDKAIGTSNLKSNPWIFPKRKRTYQNVSHLSELPSKLTLSNVLDKYCNGSDEGCQIRSEGELSNVSDQVIKTILTIGKDSKQQYKRTSLRSPLIKELKRLGFVGSLPDFVSKDLRRRRNKSNIRVLFSQSLDDRIMKKQNKILVRLGISAASDCSDATHFVTDRFMRTRNMLEAMALGKPVVTHLWLENCLEAKCFVDEKQYIMRDLKREKELGFNMLVSLARAKEHPLLKDQRVLVTPNVKPSKEMIESLIKKVHGQVVKGSQDTARNGRVMDNDLILSSEEDYAACVPFLQEGAAVYSSELILNGIVIQKLEYERHRLFKDHVHTDSRTIRQKKWKNQHVPVATCA